MVVMLKALFGETGSISMMRVMSLLCCVAAIVIAFVGVNKATPDYSGLALLCSTFLGSAMGGKILQKRIEANGAKSDVSIESK